VAPPSLVQVGQGFHPETKRSKGWLLSDAPNGESDVRGRRRHKAFARSLSPCCTCTTWCSGNTATTATAEGRLRHEQRVALPGFHSYAAHTGVSPTSRPPSPATLMSSLRMTDDSERKTPEPQPRGAADESTGQAPLPHFPPPSLTQPTHTTTAPRRSRHGQRMPHHHSAAPLTPWPADAAPPQRAPRPWPHLHGTAPPTGGSEAARPRRAPPPNCRNRRRMLEPSPLHPSVPLVTRCRSDRGMTGSGPGGA
jgi:hypothetical protein